MPLPQRPFSDRSPMLHLPRHRRPARARHRPHNSPEQRRRPLPRGVPPLIDIRGLADPLLRTPKQFGGPQPKRLHQSALGDVRASEPALRGWLYGPMAPGSAGVRPAGYPASPGHHEALLDGFMSARGVRSPIQLRDVQGQRHCLAAPDAQPYDRHQARSATRINAECTHWMNPNASTLPWGRPAADPADDCPRRPHPQALLDQVAQPDLTGALEVC
jgi:hypothetical protein